MLEKLSKKLVPIGRAHSWLRWPILGLLMLVWGLDCAWVFTQRAGKAVWAMLRGAGLTPQGIHDHAERLLDAGIAAARKLPMLWTRVRQDLLPLVYTKGREAFHASRQWFTAEHAAARCHAPRRAMAAALAVCMMLTLLPVSAFAEEGGEVPMPMAADVEAKWGTDENYAVGSGALSQAVSYANGLESGTAYIQMQKDVTHSSYITFDADKTTVLDLNGCTYTGNHVFSILKVQGNLTMRDSGTGGAIVFGTTPAYGSDGVGVSGDGHFILESGTIGPTWSAGVSLSGNAQFTMSGGSITGNKRGVTLSSNNTFTMTGGIIFGNSTPDGGEYSQYGGGVTMDGGTFNMSGGEISGNNAIGAGDVGGVAVTKYNKPVIHLSGTAKITGNVNGGALDPDTGRYTGGTPSNLYLTYSPNQSDRVVIGGGFSDGASIGVTLADFTNQKGQITNIGGTEDYAKVFFSDNPAYEVYNKAGAVGAQDAYLRAPVTATTETPTFDVGEDIQRASSNQEPITVTFSLENQYEEETTYRLYTAATDGEQPDGITATKTYYGFKVSGFTARTELWVSATEPGKAESGRAKITVLPNFPSADGAYLYLKNAQELADYFNYCEPGSAMVEGDTVTMSRDVTTMHYLSFGCVDEENPDNCFDFQGTLNMNGKALRKGPDLASNNVFALLNAGSRLTLRGGTLYDTVASNAGTLLLEDCHLQSEAWGLMSGGNVELTDTTIEIVDNGQLDDPDDAEYKAGTCALWMLEGGTLTIHTATLKNAFSEGCTYVGKVPLADCIADGSVSAPADSSAYTGDNEDWEGMQVCQETVSVTVNDPDAYQPINGGVTVDGKSIFAKGNAITITAGTESGKTNLYYTNDPKKALISLKGMGTATQTGYDLSTYTVWGGGQSIDLASTSLTMTGGKVDDLYGGGWGCNVSGTVTITMTGGEVLDTVYAGGSSSGDDDTVYTVGKAVVELSGSAVADSLSSGGNPDQMPIGACDISVMGDADISTLAFENAAAPTLTVGGNAKIEALVLNTKNVRIGVDSFAIDPDLGEHASVGLFFMEPLAAGRVIATGAVAGDVGKISLSLIESVVGPHRIYLDGTSIKCEPLPTYEVGGTVTDESGNVEDATVKLMRGKTQIGNDVTTESDGKYSFEKVPAGAYNVVASKGDKTVTRLITVTTGNLTNQNLTMPSENKNSVVEVKDDTPDVVVGGLDKIAAGEDLNGASSVTIKLIVEAKEESAADNANHIKALASGKTVSDFLDLALTKQVDANQPQSIGNTNVTVLEIVVPYDFTDKTDVTVYRYHGSAQALKQENSKADGTFRLDTANGLIYIYAAKFSTYAIAYTPAGGGDPTPPTPPSPDGGGSGGGSATYKPTVTKTEHGSVTVTPTSPSKGDKVTVTTKPDAGYVVDQITVTDKDGKNVPVEQGKDGSCTFTQPSGKVTVAVTFKPIETRPDWGAFTDVSERDWFYESVRYVYEKGLMDGTSDTTFGPYLSTSRDMIVTVLWRMEGEPESKTAAPFADVSADDDFSQAVAWGAENGIVNGYGNGSFGPNDLVTREQLAAILYRYAQYKGMDTGKTDDLTQFSDRPSAWATEAMGWAVGAGIISGRGNGVLDPTGDATRAQAAAMLMRFLER